jgi:hypothetical protein
VHTRSGQSRYSDGEEGHNGGEVLKLHFFCLDWVVLGDLFFGVGICGTKVVLRFVK